MHTKFQKFLPHQQQRQKYKKQCLKTKNILFENQQVQIGCKIVPVYDFYSSENYLQINIFVGNKSDHPIEPLKIQYKCTSNLEIFLEEKDRTVGARTQFKERVIVGCNNYQAEILLLLDISCPLLTLKNTTVPLTLFNFLAFDPKQPAPATIKTPEDLQNLIQHKYDYTEEVDIKVNSILFKKGIKNDLEKYFPGLVEVMEGVYGGGFSLKTLGEQYLMVLWLREGSIKVELSANEYCHFEVIFSNLKFLLQ